MDHLGTTIMDHLNGNTKWTKGNTNMDHLGNKIMDHLGYTIRNHLDTPPIQI